jgi:hypothetical protein
MMSNKQGFAPLTENQIARRKELEEKSACGKITEKQKEELTALVMKDEKTKEILLSDTCIDYLLDAYAERKWGTLPVDKEFMEIQQIEKGKLAEDDSLTLLSIVDGLVYCKNEERIENDFLSGIPDVFLGEEIMSARLIIDAKSCFDHPGFLKKIGQPLENGWEEQVQGYCDITGAKEGWIAHCLPNMPESMMLEYKRKLLFKMNVISEESPAFKKVWAKFERSMIFDRIPPQMRVSKVPVDTFTQIRRQQVYDRVKVCREWLWKFDEMYQKLNQSAAILV